MYEGAGLAPADVDIFNPYDGYAAPLPNPPPFAGEGRVGARPSSGTASNAATPSRSTRATSGSRDRTRSLRAAAICGTGAAARPCTPTASSSSAAPPAPARSGSGQRLRWRHSPLQAVAAGSCSANPRAYGPWHGSSPARGDHSQSLTQKWLANAEFGAMQLGPNSFGITLNAAECRRSS